MSAVLDTAPAASGASGAPVGTAKSLEADNRMEVPSIKGTEPLHEIQEWFDIILTKLEDCIPRAKDAVPKTMELKTEITYDMINQIPAQRVAHRLNNVLYPWLCAR